MTREIFSEILEEIDMTMEARNKKILLLMDNAPSHKPKCTLKNITLLMLPPNTTSTYNLLTQGLSRASKNITGNFMYAY